MYTNLNKCAFLGFAVLIIWHGLILLTILNLFTFIIIIHYNYYLPLQKNYRHHDLSILETF